MRTRWSAHPVVNFFSNDNRMEVSYGSHIRVIVILRFFIRVQEDGIRVQEELVIKEDWTITISCSHTCFIY